MMGFRRQPDCAFGYLAMSTSGLAMSLLLAGAAAAQTQGTTEPKAESSATASPTAGQTTGVAEIVVTAQKRSQDIQKVPVSITAVTGDTIKQKNLASLEALSTSVPTLHMGSGGQSDQIYIRGIGSGDDLGFEQSVGLYLDGTYLPLGRLGRVAFLDLGQVEVLEGPQSSLYGKSSIGGVVAISTAKPTNTTHYGLVSDIDFTGYGTRDVEAYISGPASDTLSGRLAARFSNTDGLFYNTAQNSRVPYSRNYSGRGSVEWKPTDRLQVNLAISGYKATSNGRSEKIGVIDTSFPTAVAFLALAKSIDPNFTPGYNTKVSTLDNTVHNDEHGTDSGVIINNTIGYDLGPAKLTSITSYIASRWRESIDADGSPITIINATEGQTVHQVSQEVRLTSQGTGPIQYLLGAYYESSQIGTPDGNSTTTFGLAQLGIPLSGSLCGDARINDKNWSVFGNLTYSPVHSLRLTVGGRYFEDRKNGSKNQFIADSDACGGPSTNAALVGFFEAGLGADNFFLSQSRKDKHFTPTGSIQYDITPHAMAYASYASGFKSGGFDVQQIDGNSSTFQFAPEKAYSIEGGFKTSWFNRALIFNINGFYSHFKDLQVSSFNGVAGFTVGNAASATSKGIETHIQAAPVRGLNLSLDADYLDAKYNNFPGAECYEGQTAAQGCTNGVTNLGGKDLAFSPHFTIVPEADYKTPINDRMDVFGEVDAHFQTSQYIISDLDPNLKFKSWTKINARIGVGAHDGSWQVSIVGKNLTNKITANLGFNEPLFAGVYATELDPPRTVAFQGKLNF